MNARKWLADNGYDDIVARIDMLTRRWKSEGIKTRRNWWETLAGDQHGRPRKVGGIEFPVLEIAQIHEGKPVTQNAIRRSETEAPPDKRYHGRSLSRLRAKGSS